MTRVKVVAVALMLAVAGPAPAQPVRAALSTCEVTHHPSRYLGRRILVKARLIDASPHGVYMASNDRRCVLDIGDMAPGQPDVVSFFFWSSNGKPVVGRGVRVIADGALKTEMREDPWGRKYRSYFLDPMKITRIDATR